MTEADKTNDVSKEAEAGVGSTPPPCPQGQKAVWNTKTQKWECPGPIVGGGGPGAPPEA